MYGFAGVRASALASAVALTLTGAGPARAQEALVTYKSISPELALEAAQATLKRCRADGFQVTVVVMDRFGQQLVLLRDRFAGLPSPATAAAKAYTAIGFRMSSADFARAVEGRQMSAELARLPNIMAGAGGLPLEAGGTLVGAIGVAGASGGDKDEACAKAGMEAIQDKLEF